MIVFIAGLGFGIIGRRDCAHLLYHVDDEQQQKSIEED